MVHPLNIMLRDGSWWQCSKKIMEAPVLAHYDLHLLIQLTEDASSYGIGAVLSHILPDGSEKPSADIDWMHHEHADKWTAICATGDGGIIVDVLDPEVPSVHTCAGFHTEGVGGGTLVFPPPPPRANVPPPTFWQLCSYKTRLIGS